MRTQSPKSCDNFDCVVWLIGIAVSALVTSSCSQSHLDVSERPNIVVILADDLGYGDIGAYGATKIRTPNIDYLARRGLRFTNAYASANVCSPSRAGLMTGRYAIRSGLAYKVVTAAATHGLPESEETIGELLTRAGYQSALIGKWHLGNRSPYLPPDHGFAEFFGVPHSNDMPNFVLYDGLDIVDEEINQATLTRRYTERAQHIIRNKSQRPFFLMVSHTFPHIPLFASSEFKGHSEAGLYGDAVEELDWSTGEIIRTLRESGQLDNTLIIFTSDNGPFFEGSTAGLKGGKGNSWEGGYRVPFIMHWPNNIRSSTVSDAITMNIDVLPTLAEAANVVPRTTPVDGASMFPLIANPSSQIHEFLYFFNNENIVALRSKDWKFVSHAYYTGSLGAFEKFDQLPGFNGSYDMLLDARGVDGEAYSYADRHPEVVSQFKTELRRARAEFYPLRTRPSEKTYPE